MPAPYPVPADFAALVHDLRQPLSTIETCACLLRMVLHGETDERVFENLDRIERQVAEAHSILREAVRARAHEAAGSPLTNSTKAAGA